MEQALRILVIFIFILFIFFIVYFLQAESPFITIVLQKNQLNNQILINYAKKYQYHIINYNKIPKTFHATYYVTLNKIPQISLDNMFKFVNNIPILICKNNKKILAYAIWGKYYDIVWQDYLEYFNDNNIIKQLNKRFFYQHLSPNFAILSNKILYPKNIIFNKHLIKENYPCRVSTFWGKSLIPRNFLHFNKSITVDSNVKNNIKSCKKIYNTYDHYYYSNYTCQKFLQQNYSNNVLKSWYKISDKKLKTFFFVVCWLYIKGGIYSSYKLIHRESLEKYLVSNNLLLLCNNNNKFSTDILASKAKNKMFKNILQDIIFLTNNNLHCNINNLIATHLTEQNRLCKIVKKKIFFQNKKITEFIIDDVVYIQK